jgi:hypothetical protein
MSSFIVSFHVQAQEQCGFAFQNPSHSAERFTHFSNPLKAWQSRPEGDGSEAEGIGKDEVKGERPAQSIMHIQKA